MALKVFERYLAREIYGATALVLAAFLMLFAFFDFIGEIQQLGKGGYQLHHAASFVLLTLPGRVYELFPIAVLIGTLYALTLLARHSEITVLRASGLSTGALLRSLGKLGLVFVVLTFLFGEVVAPPAEKAAQQLRLKATGSMVAQEFRSGLWVKDERSFINVRDMQPDATLSDIRIYEFDDGYHLRAISEAKSGKYDNDGRWQLKDVVQTLFVGGRASIRRMPEVDWQSALTPDILSVLLVVPEKMSLMNLYQYTRHLLDNRQKTERYEIALWKKLIYPMTALVMMALALPFGYLHSRMGAVSLKVFTGVMLGIGFHMLNGLFSSLGVINGWIPFWAAVTPSALFLLGAAGMLWWVERR
ncbi:LPS export ABC transporter permease LptG [Denitratisoma sp. DHT3]|uniref:LPS export ABC transporter permease LptG n=1 Tax=Denitratisoma sp. DHT3 TaxID=1981880 RepID=UPI0028F710D3|nr:LPS export ABC transporter permease LptG [Denitratisoma sp. DHT3]